MISRSLTRRLENLEYRFEPVGEPAGEPTIINLNFVDRDLKVVNQMQMTIAAPRTTLAGERDHGDEDDQDRPLSLLTPCGAGVRRTVGAERMRGKIASDIS
jgi:hypothetical protein